MLNISDKPFTFSKHFDAYELDEINTFIRENDLVEGQFMCVYCDDFYTLYYNE